MITGLVPTCEVLEPQTENHENSLIHLAQALEEQSQEVTLQSDWQGGQYLLQRFQIELDVRLLGPSVNSPTSAEACC